MCVGLYRNKSFYYLAVLVIALYGHSCLCFMTFEADPIMADPSWLSKIHNGLVIPIMAWLNLGIQVKSRSQLINKLMVTCNGMAKVLTFGHT